MNAQDDFLLKLLNAVGRARQHHDIKAIRITFDPPIESPTRKVIGECYGVPVEVDVPTVTQYRYTKTLKATARQWFPGQSTLPDRLARRIRHENGRYTFSGSPLMPGDWLVYDHAGSYTHVVSDAEFKKTYQPVE